MPYHRRSFSELEGKRLLEILQVTRVAVRELTDHAPINSEIYRALNELWETTRHVGEVVTGDPTYFEPVGRTSDGVIQGKSLILRTWP